MAVVGSLIGAISPTTAAVLVDDTGIGSIGKGDVQLAFGWNNKQMQANYKAVSFSGRFKQTYEWVCEGTDEVKVGTGKYVTKYVVTVYDEKSKNLNSELSIGTEGKVKNQFVGWALTGIVDSTLPTSEKVGDCQGQYPTLFSQPVAIGDMELVEMKAAVNDMARSWTFDPLVGWVLKP